MSYYCMEKIHEKSKDNQSLLKLIVEGGMDKEDSESSFGVLPVENKGFWYCWRTKTEKGQGFIPFKNARKKIKGDSK